MAPLRRTQFEIAPEVLVELAQVGIGDLWRLGSGTHGGRHRLALGVGGEAEGNENRKGGERAVHGSSFRVGVCGRSKGRKASESVAGGADAASDPSMPHAG